MIVEALFVCDLPVVHSGKSQWHFPTMLCMLWNAFEVAHHVGACACVCTCDRAVRTFISVAILCCL